MVGGRGELSFVATSSAGNLLWFPALFYPERGLTCADEWIYSKLPGLRHHRCAAFARSRYVGSFASHLRMAAVPLSKLPAALLPNGTGLSYDARLLRSSVQIFTCAFGSRPPDRCFENYDIRLFQLFGPLGANAKEGASALDIHGRPAELGE